MSALPKLHTADEVADALGVSAWWVQEQARRERVPVTRAAGSYRFTDRQFQQLLALLEQPAAPPVTRTTAGRRAPAARTDAAAPTAPVVRLVARTPRRKRTA
ncbi:DNA-binding protein [Streptomyces sp. NPDC002248]